MPLCYAFLGKVGCNKEAFKWKSLCFIYITPVSAEDQMMAATSPEDRQKGMEPWLAWFNKYGAELVDAGTALGKGMHFNKTDSSKAQSHVAGYSIVQAENMDAVKAMITDHPHYMMPEASIEVLEMLPMAM